MAKFKIIHDRPECIGCGACAAIDPDNWEMADDGYSDLIDSKNEGDEQIKEVNNLGANMDAAESCPVNCIHIYENKEKKI